MPHVSCVRPSLYVEVRVFVAGNKDFAGAKLTVIVSDKTVEGAPATVLAQSTYDLLPNNWTVAGMENNWGGIFDKLRDEGAESEFHFTLSTLSISVQITSADGAVLFNLNDQPLIDVKDERGYWHYAIIIGSGDNQVEVSKSSERAISAQTRWWRKVHDSLRWFFSTLI